MISIPDPLPVSCFNAVSFPVSTESIIESMRAFRKLLNVPAEVLVCSEKIETYLRQRIESVTGSSLGYEKIMGMPVYVVPGMVGWKIVPKSEWDRLMCDCRYAIDNLGSRL